MLSPIIGILCQCNTFVTNVAAVPGYGWSPPSTNSEKIR